ncbi:hypothetical protein GCM10011584_17260 [Nocardioides phosphati]|uniref:DUF403 domain-containing protein n=1 Tax=Nocardioides phosphati TaxID=1867775 RepID=A0ABQ2NAS2_9ACTN|nr:circularly permuted type 2 ATP-grasp protein [Nocardioides phosphati]GGO88973.1 hypothetical protein GCM10011584_17260 [Nocardioides phosphati]
MTTPLNPADGAAPASGAPTAVSSGVLAAYAATLRDRPADPLRGVDELVAGEGLRPEQQLLADAVDAMGMPGLLAARHETRRLVHDDGIRYGVSGRDGVRDLDWRLDPLPVVLSAAEWAGLERGLQQRAALLELIHDDLYGERLLLRRGVIPAEVVLGHPGFLRQVDHVRSRGGLVVGAHDLGRDADGSWRVLADRMSAPSGAGYAMANRRVTTRVLAGLHRSTELARLRGFFHTMSAAVREAAPPSSEVPRVVLYSPGSMSETAYDQSFLASLLGFPLAESDDLVVRDGRVWLRAAGRLEPVDVLLRRVDPEYCDPLDLRGDSQLGLPGLVEATRRGTLTVANPLGAQVLENPGLAPFLQAASQALLGEDLQLTGKPAWWCGDRDGLAHVLDSFDRLVIRPLATGGPERAHLGAHLAPDAREELRRRIQAEPWAWVGQEPLPLSTAPVVTPRGLVPGRVVVRTFWAQRDGERHVMPGGLARAGVGAPELHVSSSAGAIAKDVWVLAPETAESGWGDPGVRPELVAVRPRAVVAPRVADNLFWLGRYAERAEAAGRVLRVCDDLVEDHASRPGTPGEQAMRALLAAATTITRVPGDPAQPRAHVRTMVTDPRQSGSLRYAADRLGDAAQRVRDQLSQDIWHVLSRLDRTLAHVPSDEHQLQPHLYDVLESLLAVSGVIAESMVRDETWGFLDGGIRLERAQFTVALLAATLAQERPPIIDGQLTEAVLEVGESILTHRRRTVAGEGPVWPIHSAVSLLLLDRGNPRSVAFSIDRLAEDLHLVGDEVLAAKAEALAGQVARVDLVEACAGDRTGLAEILGEVRASLFAVSDDLTRRRFARKTSQQTLPINWAVTS